MLKNCKVDFLGNSRGCVFFIQPVVCYFHFRVAGGGMQSPSSFVLHPAVPAEGSDTAEISYTRLRNQLKSNPKSRNHERN
jgi:hypothetical protein